MTDTAADNALQATTALLLKRGYVEFGTKVPQWEPLYTLPSDASTTSAGTRPPMADRRSILAPRDELLRAMPKTSINPMVELHGPGPEWKKCRSCKHMYYDWEIVVRKRHHKCTLRETVDACLPAHRLSWPACAKWERY